MGILWEEEGRSRGRHYRRSPGSIPGYGRLRLPHAVSAAARLLMNALRRIRG
jgi:hypothetical protein